MEKPIETFKAGAIQASIFMNEREIDGKKVQIPSVSFQKSFMGDDGKWKTTSSLNADELPKAILVLSKAYGYVMEAREADQA